MCVCVCVCVCVCLCVCVCVCVYKYLNPKPYIDICYTDGLFDPPDKICFQGTPDESVVGECRQGRRKVVGNSA